MSSTREQPDRDTTTGPRLSPVLLWFAVIGGPVAWSVHLLVSWSTMEVACLTPTPGAVLQRGPAPGPPASTIVYLATALPWVVSVLALLVALRLRRRSRNVDADVLAQGRVGLLLVIGITLDLMSIAAITGGAIGLLVLEPCG